MDNRYYNPPKSQQNYYEGQKYEQPATQSVVYQKNYGYQADPNVTTGKFAAPDYQYSEQFPDPGGQDGYVQQDYGEENAEGLSLSDYNSHESCIKISTKK